MLFLTVLEAWKFKIKVPVDSWSEKSPLPGFRTAAFSQCSHREERGSPGVSPFPYKGTDPVMGAPPLGPHLNLILSQRPHLQIPSHWELGFPHVHLGGDTDLQSIRWSVHEMEYHSTIKRNRTVCFPVCEPWKARWKKPDTKGHTLYDSFYGKCPE